MNRVDEGSHLVDLAAATISHIAEPVELVVAIVSEITSATVEQSAGIDLVHVAVSEID